MEDEMSKFLELNNLPLSQENGQRMMGPPSDWIGPPPPRGSEVFIKQIPREFMEHDILPVFMELGKVYLFRLMMDFSGTNRGYAFLQYCDQETAKQAVRRLDNYPMRNGINLRVSLSVDNQRLFFGRINKHLSKEDIERQISLCVQGVKKVILYKAAADKNLNRGFCFVDFNSHRQAALARRKLVGDRNLGIGSDLKIDWAIPEDHVEEQVMDKVSTLYLRNLMLQTHEKSLIAAVSEFVGIEKVTRVRKVNDFAFIHFTDRETAEIARQALNGYVLDNSVIEASWARPPRKEASSKSVVMVDINQNITGKNNFLPNKRPEVLKKAALVPMMSAAVSANTNENISDVIQWSPHSECQLSYNRMVHLLSHMSPTQALSEMVKEMRWGHLDISIYQHTTYCNTTQYSVELKILHNTGYWLFPITDVLYLTAQEASNGASLAFIQKYILPNITY